MSSRREEERGTSSAGIGSRRGEKGVIGKGSRRGEKGGVGKGSRGEGKRQGKFHDNFTDFTHSFLNF